MPDWKRILRERLAHLRVSPVRAEEIAEELAADLEQHYSRAISRGATGDAAFAAASCEPGSEEELARRIRETENWNPPPPGLETGAEERANAGEFLAGRALRLAHAEQEPDVHAGSGADAGAGHRREHRGLQRGVRRAAAAVAVQRAAPAGVVLGHVPQRAPRGRTRRIFSITARNRNRSSCWRLPAAAPGAFRRHSPGRENRCD